MTAATLSGIPYHGRAVAVSFDHDRAAANINAKHAHARRKALAALPFKLRQSLAADWATRSVGGVFQWNQATRELHQHARYITNAARAVAPVAEAARIASRDQLAAWSSDISVRAWAKRRAGECAALVADFPSATAAAVTAAEFAAAQSFNGVAIRLPKEPKNERQVMPYLARLTCPRWWRRAARVMLGRGIEGAAIDEGRVHRQAGVYLSDRNADRGAEAQKRNAQLLLDMDAENELGERVNLAELAKGSISNPWVRFSEMMVTIKGLEALAKAAGLAGRFVTWTLPSRYHARLSASCEPNPAYDGSRPRDGQAALRELWARFRARVQAWGVRVFGLRVAEPHHDGTPHWHLMLWIQPGEVDRAVEALRELALEESPNEPGAAQHRCKVEVIDERGAAGYLAKYVSKMTVAAGVGDVTERGADGQVRAVQKGQPSKAAQRARWWASLHGIRQFQFFGIPPRGVWRECRRVREPITADVMPGATADQLDLFERVRATADASDYAGHVDALGGIGTPRDLIAVQLLKREAEGLNAYGEERPLQVFGLCMPDAIRARIVTREHVWALKPARPVESFQGLDARPWTRVNNCKPGDAETRQESRPVPDCPPDRVPDPRPDWWDAWFPGVEFRGNG